MPIFAMSQINLIVGLTILQGCNFVWIHSMRIVQKMQNYYKLSKKEGPTQTHHTITGAKADHTKIFTNCYKSYVG